MTTEFANIPLATIAPSLTNPRKHFDAAKLAELAESIKAMGVHQPVLVRPLPGSRVADTERGVQYELVCGERRLRASQQAAAPTIPAMVRELTDDQVLEIQIVENLQRDDLSELEEAEGYTQLMERCIINADQVAERIGKSRSYVYARLRLRDLTPESKQALRDGKIDASRALLIARIPDSKLQAKALEYASEPDYQGDQVGVRDFQAWLKKNVMLRLEHATFVITDTRLVQSAGSCKDCPKRTGANPDLFAEVDSADICTDPACFHSKEDAHRAKLRVQAEKKGLRVVDGKEAQEMCKSWHTVPDGYSTLGQVRNDITKDGKTGYALRDLLGKDAPNAILFEHPRTKELMELVPTDEAEAVLLAKGYAPKNEDDEFPDDLASLEHELSAHASWQEQRIQQAVAKDIDAATIQAARATDDKAAKALLTSSAFLRAWLTSLTLHSVPNDDMAQALGFEFTDGEVEVDALVAYIKSCSHADLCRAAILCALEGEEQAAYGDAVLPVKDHLQAELGVPVKAIADKATKRVKAEYSAKTKAIQAKIDALKVPPPIAPLAQPKHAGGGAKTKGQKPPAAPRVAKPKLSAEDAKSGIAAAMQDADRAATAPPEAQQSEMGEGICVGKKVQVTSDPDKLPLKKIKYKGKEGTVTEKQGDSAWWVTFKGRSGGLACFDVSELAVAA